MNLRLFKALIAIADYGTFGAAGEVSFLSQSAASQQVRIIEEFLGVEIFDCTVRPPALTPHDAPYFWTPVDPLKKGSSAL